MTSLKLVQRILVFGTTSRKWLLGYFMGLSGRVNVFPYYKCGDWGTENLGVLARSRGMAGKAEQVRYCQRHSPDRQLWLRASLTALPHFHRAADSLHSSNKLPSLFLLPFLPFSLPLFSFFLSFLPPSFPPLLHRPQTSNAIAKAMLSQVFSPSWCLHLGEPKHKDLEGCRDFHSVTEITFNSNNLIIKVQ